MAIKKILIIIDVQNDFVEGSLGTKEAKNIIPNIINKMRSYEGADNLILFTKDTHFDNYLDTAEGKKLPIPHCIYGTSGWSIHKDISNEFKRGNYFTHSSSTVINGRILKNYFASLELAQIIKQYNPEEVEICGLVTDICVISNALLIKAINPDVPLIINANCCAGVTPDKHEAALETMRSCQIKVI